MDLLSTAFDIQNHDLLIAKLEVYYRNSNQVTSISFQHFYQRRFGISRKCFTQMITGSMQPIIILPLC